MLLLLQNYYAETKQLSLVYIGIRILEEKFWQSK